MANRKYRVVITHSGKQDIKEKKNYILQQFKYRVMQDGMDWKNIIGRWLQENAAPR